MKLNRNLLVFTLVSTLLLLGGCNYTYTTENKEYLKAFEELNLKEVTLEDIYNQRPNQYISFLYQDECQDCMETIEKLKDYQKTEDSLPIFLINLSTIDKEKLKNDFTNVPVGIIVQVKENEDGEKKEVHRWFGLNSVDDLPTKE